MSLISASLFYKNRDYGVGNITFDLILAENHNLRNIVTQYKIEDGSDISDHILNDVRDGVVSGLITNFSIEDSGFLINKAQTAFNTLEQLWKDRKLVDIYTVYKVYKNVAITNISIAKDSNTGEALIADFSFQEITKVSLQTINILANISLEDMSSDINRQSAVNFNAGKTVGL
jgi:hypothetical protein